MRCLLYLSGIAFCLLALMEAGQTNTADLYHCAHEPVLVQALQHLSESTAHETTNKLVAHGTRLLFKDMREMGPLYRSHDAVTWVTHDGRQVIYINQRHQTAPPQALAALISHEALHDDPHNSLQEEYSAWQQEGRTWQDLCQRYPELKRIALKTIPLVDRLNAITLLMQQHRLEHEIRTNTAYRQLSEHSPGF
jgi:hypothetical protein